MPDPASRRYGRRARHDALGRPAAVIPPQLRRSAAAAAIGCALILLYLSVRHARTDRPGVLDAVVDAALRPGGSEHAAAAWMMIQLGDPLGALVLTAMLALAAHGTGRTPVAVLAVVAMPVTAAAVFALKPLVGRTLDGTLSFPSGHTAAVTTVAATTGLLMTSAFAGRVVVTALLCGAGTVGVASAMGSALVMRGWHHATDVAGGFCLAVCCVIALAFVLDRLDQAAERP